MTNFQLRYRLWIDTERGTFLADGRVELLKRIQETGSISKAATSMKMSYKKAWEMISSMNEYGNQALVIRTSGGKGGGGTALTPYAQNLILYFEDLQSRMDKYLADERAKIVTGIEV